MPTSEDKPTPSDIRAPADLATSPPDESAIREQKILFKVGIKERIQNMEERKSFSTRIFVLVALWLLAVLWAIVRHPEIPEKVQLTLIGSTTFTVVGLFGAVAKYLFHHKDES